MQNNDHQLIDILRLIRSENIGNKTYFDLIKLFGSPKEAIKMAPELAKRGGGNKSFKIISQAVAESELEQCYKFKAQMLSYLDRDYPILLKQIHDFPPILTIKGDKSLLDLSKVAIVGARNASLNGRNFAQKIANDLSNKNIVIVSGLARGIDTAAHLGALNIKTIAVIAGGIDHVYPIENQKLFQDIANSGLLVAELPFGIKPRSQNFPQRNRIIAGLSKAIAVIEAGLNSGSLITAKFALEQNREIYAVPGSPYDPRSKGTNSLLKQGAKLLESADDILQDLNNQQFNYFSERDDQSILTKSITPPRDSELIKAREEIKFLIGASPIEIEQLVANTQYNISVVLTVILELELAGKIERHYGNKISILFNEN